MPRAISQPLRAELVRLRQEGRTHAEIARTLGLKERTVRSLWRRYREQGEAGLPPAYTRCGRTGPRFAPALYEAALAAKREHPRWGAALIRLTLAQQFPQEPLPRVRTLQAWFQQAGLQRPRMRRPSAPRDRAREAHAVWQLDGKEGMRLADGTPTVALNLVDEATGAVVSATVFPPGEVQSGALAPSAGLVGSGVHEVGLAPAATGG